MQRYRRASRHRLSESNCYVPARWSGHITYEAQRAKSNADFVSKIEGGLQELEETVYWLELLAEAEVVHSDRLKLLREEAEELTAVLVTVVKHAKAKMR
jgi:four helix bundle protein